jgi:transposase
LYFQDESRFGLFTRNGKSLTAKGVKPVCTFQQVFKNLWVFGAFSPITGDSFLLEMPHCNSLNFQHFLNEFSNERPQEYKIIVLDNGAFHKAKTLEIPLNIGLIFLPPYNPELNPAEKIWANLKRKFTNKFCKTLDEVSEFITYSIQGLEKEVVKKTCDYEYILSNSNWTI